ncbi:transposase [Streptomyces sp. NPDC056921]|uniref:transposase n=1 Tax=Streptomyces sp. NPDC056921 TaxID=3345966 RepID=UPI0036448942
MDARPGRSPGRPGAVELHFLPSYSPELNPDELVNADLKHSLPGSTEAAIRSNSPPRPVDSSADAGVGPTSSATTSAARTSATSWTRTP